MAMIKGTRKDYMARTELRRRADRIMQHAYRDTLFPPEHIPEWCFKEAERRLRGESETPYRPKSGNEVGRLGDMGRATSLRVGFDSDNDVYVAVCDDEGLAGVEFCTPGAGGGNSPETRKALIALMAAIERDNEQDASRDWHRLRGEEG